MIITHKSSSGQKKNHARENEMDMLKSKTFIIAELSANHGQNLKTAVETIRAARRSGADAVKLQTYTPDTITLDCDNEFFKDVLRGTLWEGRRLFDLYQEAYTPWEWHKELFHAAREEGLICFSTPFDKTAVDFLEQFKPLFYKIASFEIQDIPLIEYAALKGKPMIISTGIAECEDIELAVRTCRDAGNNDIILLKCTSAYPAPMDEANLTTIPDMKARFGVEVGLSDHTLGIVAPVVAVSLGASVIEKHFILNKSIGGPDAAFSLDEVEFTKMVKAIREAEKAMGRVSYALTEKIKESRKFSRSLFAVKDIKQDELFTDEYIRSIRPGFGLHPKYFNSLLGKKAKKAISKGIPLSWEMME
jgi:pseudaminic acid synthase